MIRYIDNELLKSTTTVPHGSSTSPRYVCIPVFLLQLLGFSISMLIFVLWATSEFYHLFWWVMSTGYPQIHPPARQGYPQPGDLQKGGSQPPVTQSRGDGFWKGWWVFEIDVIFYLFGFFLYWVSFFWLCMNFHFVVFCVAARPCVVAARWMPVFNIWWIFSLGLIFVMYSFFCVVWKRLQAFWLYWNLQGPYFI